MSYMNPKTMRAAYINTNLNLYVESNPVPEPADDEVLIQVCYTGICGSDLHYYHEGRVGDNVIRGPHILGHESSGIVVRVGREVEGLAEGDQVAVEPGVPCMVCRYCLTGHYNLCLKVRFLGAPPYPGTFREYLCHKGVFTHKLPKTVGLKTGSLIEPLAVGYNAVEKLRLKPSERLLISGAGPIGITTMLIARSAGAIVTIADVDEYRLNLASKMGADEVLNVRESLPEPMTYDCAVEASGNVRAFDTLMNGVRKGSRIVLVGMTSEALSVNVNSILKKELTIRSVYRYVNHFQPVIELLSAGQVKADDIITHEYGINDIVDAFKFTDDPKNQKMKVVINFNKEG